MGLRKIFENLDPDINSFTVGIRNGIYSVSTSTNYGALNTTRYSNLEQVEEHVEGLMVEPAEEDDGDLL